MHTCLHSLSIESERICGKLGSLLNEVKTTGTFWDLLTIQQVGDTVQLSKEGDRLRSGRYHLQYSYSLAHHQSPVAAFGGGFCFLTIQSSINTLVHGNQTLGHAQNTTRYTKLLHKPQPGTSAPDGNHQQNQTDAWAALGLSL